MGCVVAVGVGAGVVRWTTEVWVEKVGSAVGGRSAVDEAVVGVVEGVVVTVLVGVDVVVVPAEGAVARFLDEETTRCNGFATNADLFARWSRWAMTDGTEPISQRAFSQALEAHGLTGDKGTNGKRIRRGVILNLEDGDDS